MKLNSNNYILPSCNILGCRWSLHYWSLLPNFVLHHKTRTQTKTERYKTSYYFNDIARDTVTGLINNGGEVLSSIHIGHHFLFFLKIKYNF